VEKKVCLGESLGVKGSRRNLKFGEKGAQKQRVIFLANGRLNKFYRAFLVLIKRLIEIYYP